MYLKKKNHQNLTDIDIIRNGLITEKRIHAYMYFLNKLVIWVFISSKIRFSPESTFTPENRFSSLYCCILHAKLQNKHLASLCTCTKVESATTKIGQFHENLIKQMQSAPNVYKILNIVIFVLCIQNWTDGGHSDDDTDNHTKWSNKFQ